MISVFVAINFSGCTIIEAVKSAVNFYYQRLPRLPPQSDHSERVHNLLAAVAALLPLLLGPLRILVLGVLVARHSVNVLDLLQGVLNMSSNLIVNLEQSLQLYFQDYGQH